MFLTQDPQDCKHFTLDTGFRYVQDFFKTGFTVCERTLHSLRLPFSNIINKTFFSV